jgi:hypothetical protein
MELIGSELLSGAAAVCAKLVVARRMADTTGAASVAELAGDLILGRKTSATGD